jgi:hypothetical protein
MALILKFNLIIDDLASDTSKLSVMIDTLQKSGIVVNILNFGYKFVIAALEGKPNHAK